MINDIGCILNYYDRHEKRARSKCLPGAQKEARVSKMSAYLHMINHIHTANRKAFSSH